LRQFRAKPSANASTVVATGSPPGLPDGSVARDDRAGDAALDLGHGHIEVERDPGMVLVAEADPDKIVRSGSGSASSVLRIARTAR